MRNITGLGMMMGAIAAGMAAEMKPYAGTPIRDHTDRLDALYGERDRRAAEEKRARKNVRRAAQECRS